MVQNKSANSIESTAPKIKENESSLSFYFVLPVPEKVKITTCGYFFATLATIKTPLSQQLHLK